MMTPSATAPTAAAWPGVPIPKPTATGTRESAFVLEISSSRSGCS